MNYSISRVAAVLALLVGLVSSAQAGRVVYEGYLANEDALAYSKTFDLDANSFGIDVLSMQAVFSSVTIPTVSFGTSSLVGAGTNRVQVTAHGLSTGLPVLYTLVSGSNPGSLVSGTTYYGIRVDANNFKLSDTSTGAIAGTPVVTISTVATGSYTLAPLAFGGTWGFNWQVSNDGSNFYTLTTSSVTYSAPSQSVWEGNLYYRYFRLNFSAGTAGGMSLKVRGRGLRAN